MEFYRVQAGDTVYGIARKFFVLPEVLIADNGLYGILDALPVGMCIVLRRAVITHTVKSGETLTGIAAAYGVELTRLYRANLFLEGGETIYPGERLMIAFEGENEAPYSFVIGGYAYPSIGTGLLGETLPFCSRLMPFTYGFSDEDTLVELRDEALLSACRDYGTEAFMHVSTLTQEGVFSNELASRLLSERERWGRLSDRILQKMEEKGYRGLDIDFEFLLADDRERYVDFIGYMRSRMNAAGYPLVVALPPKVRDDQPGLLYEGIDYRGLGQAADECLLMTYEWGYTYGPPMAVSPLPSVKRVVEYAVSVIPHEKLLLGLSNYGYDWPLPYVRGVTKARSLSVTEAVKVASMVGAEIVYDREAQAPTFHYTDAVGKEHEVWFEDGESLKKRLELIDAFGLGGGLYWNLNRPDPQNLAMLSLYVKNT